jgi:hypothetical protein
VTFWGARSGRFRVLGFGDAEPALGEESDGDYP